MKDAGGAEFIKTMVLVRLGVSKIVPDNVMDACCGRNPIAKCDIGMGRSKNGSNILDASIVGFQNESLDVIHLFCDSKPNRKMATKAWGSRKTCRKHLADRFCNSRTNRK